MRPEDILHGCFNLIWDFGECYDSDDINNFQHENLLTWSQHDKVNKHFKQMQQAVKTLKEIEEFCKQKSPLLESENRWFSDEIQNIINKAEEE